MADVSVFNINGSDINCKDKTARNNITSEIANRKSADSDLQTNINNETSARVSADSTLQKNIDSEASTRKSADSTLQTNIDNEASVRKSADSTLQTNIDSEASARAAADKNYSGDTQTVTLTGAETINAKDIILNPSSGAVTYSKPVTDGKLVKIPFKATDGTSYNVLCEGSDIGSSYESILFVGKGCDFETIADAISEARKTCTPTNRVLLFLAPQTFNESITLNPNPGIDMIGYGATIKTATTYPEAALYTVGVGYFCGIYFNNTASSYAVHIEAQNVSEYQHGNMTFRDCFFQSNGHAGLGMGLGSEIFFRAINCEFYTSGGASALYYHNYPAGSSAHAAIFNNCLFNGGSTANIIYEDAAHMRGNSNTSICSHQYINCNGSTVHVQINDTTSYTNFYEAGTADTNISLSSASLGNSILGADYSSGWFYFSAAAPVVNGSAYIPTPFDSSRYSYEVRHVRSIPDLAEIANPTFFTPAQARFMQVGNLGNISNALVELNCHAK